MRLIFILLFITLGLRLSGQNADVRLLRHIYNLPTRPPAYLISESGAFAPIAVPAAMLIVGVVSDNPVLMSDALFVGSTVAEASLVTLWFKMLVNRKRPYQAYPDQFRPFDLYRAGGASFPSGHTSGAFALATSLSIAYPKWYVIAPTVLWACGVGFSRMNQGVHYPSDVLAGAAIGVGCAFVNRYLNDWMHTRLKVRTDRHYVPY